MVSGLEDDGCRPVVVMGRDDGGALVGLVMVISFFFE